MKRPLFIRSLTEEERHHIHAELRTKDAFVLLRCQIVLASARGARVSEIALALSCKEETVRRVIHAFHTIGLRALQPGSRRPHNPRSTFSLEHIEVFKQLLHQSPQDFGKSWNQWTLKRLAEVCYTQGLTPRQLTVEGIRKLLLRLGIDWVSFKREVRQSTLKQR